MTAIGTLPVVLGTGVHGSRPAASAVGKGGLYSCTTHSLIYQTDGSTWTTWGTLGTSTTTVATDTIWDTTGDLAVGTGPDTAARLAVGSNAGYALVTRGAGIAPWWAQVAAGGSVATDTIWDAAGDLAVGTGANTAAKLPVGADGEILTLVAGVPSWEANAGVADILDLTTAEMDDTLVLAPDGAGGVEFRAEAGGGGGATTPHFYQAVRANGTNTITAIASGRRLIVGIVAYGGTVTGITCTNVTFTQVGTDLSFNSNKTSVWVGVATGTSGTSVTFTGSGTILNIIVEVADALTPTLGAQASATAAGGFINNSVRAATMTAGHLVVGVGMTDNTSTLVWTDMAFPHTRVPMSVSVQATSMSVGYAPSGDATISAISTAASSGATYAVSIT